MNVIHFRKAIRKFKTKDIYYERIGQILEAGRLSHTVKNKQDVSFVILDKEKINLYFFRVSIVIVILAEDKCNPGSTKYRIYG